MADDTQKLIEETMEETPVEPVADETVEEVVPNETSVPAISEPTEPVVEEKTEGTVAEPEGAAESPVEPVSSDAKAMDDKQDILAEEKKEVVVPDNAKWFIIHTYAGHENKVAKPLRQRAETMGFADKIFNI